MGMSPEAVTVVVNNFVSLTCEATGFPPPTLSWLNDRGPIQANTNALIMPGTANLELSTGSHWIDWTLKSGWQLKPFFVKRIMRIIIIWIWECHKNNQKQVVCPFLPLGGRTLQILKAKVSDGGKYSCVAMNAAGEAYKHIYLTVLGQYTSTMCTAHWVPHFGL